jgi:hypothetical protein
VWERRTRIRRGVEDWVSIVVVRCWSRFSNPEGPEMEVIAEGQLKWVAAWRRRSRW